MIAQTTYFVTCISLEFVVVSYVIIGHIKPEIIPYHDTVAVTVVVELIVRNAACPEAYHVVVHLFMQSYLWLVLLSMAAEQIFRHTPVATFCEDALPVDHELQYRHSYSVVLNAVLILANAEVNGAGVRDNTIDKRFHLAVIEERLAISVRPPQLRIVDRKLLKIIRCKAYVLGFPRFYRNALFALYIAWSNGAAQCDVLLRCGTVLNV